MLRASAAIILFLATEASAQVVNPGFTKVAAMGDSITTAANSDDNCAWYFCAFSLGSKWNNSWATGTSVSSVRAKLGVGSSIQVAENGKRWWDGRAQAQSVVSQAAGQPTLTTIWLGGNDVCRQVDAPLDTKADMLWEIDETFKILQNLPAGSTVMVLEVPNIELLRETMRYQQARTGSCQSVWDQYHPCGVVLDSASNDARRAAAYQLNREINEAIKEKVDQFSGDVHFVTAADLYEFAFTGNDVSRIDCFHPNKDGQNRIANRVWSTGTPSFGYNEASGVYAAGISRAIYRRVEPQRITYEAWTTRQANLAIWIQAEDPNHGCNNVGNCFIYPWDTSRVNQTHHYFDISGDWMEWGRWRVWAATFPVSAGVPTDCPDYSCPQFTQNPRFDLMGPFTKTAWK
jgi:lysophospholipase L1-like esterase